MKKLTALLIVLSMLLSIGTAAFAADPVSYEHLTVGSITQMKGDFFTEMWGNASSDIDVRMLIHGYDLIVWDGDKGAYHADQTVVTDLKKTVDAATGNHSYAISLAHDLYYSDGTKITAWDYAFSFLLQMAGEIGEIGGAPLRREHILGATAYAEGKTNTLSGVKVLDKYVLSITLDGTYLPFYYEEGLLSCCPYPISVIAPGCEVKDDGEGVYLKGNFSAALLESTINGTNGYRSHPDVVCGPYKLISFDGITAELERNRYYKGNASGEKPKFEKLTFTLADYETMIEKLQNGEFQLLNRVTKADTINAGLHTGAGTESVSYPRTGLSHIAFCCEKDAVSSEAVRQAIAWCMDRDAIAMDYTGSYGKRVDSFYGLGQWMYQLAVGNVKPPIQEPKNKNDSEATAEYKKEQKEWEALNLKGLTAYTLDVNKAANLLEKDGWKLNAEGIREKNGVKLDLVLLCPEGNRIAEIFEKRLVPNLEKAGIRLTVKTATMPELLGQYYKQKDREADMIYLASDFGIMYDPSVYFQTGEDGEAYWASTNQSDEQLYQLAVAMRQTEPGETLEYVKKWIAFEERFNKVLPMIPIYSNTFYDFYTSKLQDYEIVKDGSWGIAIIGAKLRS